MIMKSMLGYFFLVFLMTAFGCYSRQEVDLDKLYCLYDSGPTCEIIDKFNEYIAQCGNLPSKDNWINNSLIQINELLVIVYIYNGDYENARKCYNQVVVGKNLRINLCQYIEKWSLIYKDENNRPKWMNYSKFESEIAKISCNSKK